MTSLNPVRTCLARAIVLINLVNEQQNHFRSIEKLQSQITDANSAEDALIDEVFANLIRTKNAIESEKRKLEMLISIHNSMKNNIAVNC